MEKKPFVTLEQLKEIDKTYPTPYHIYDEKGIRENVKKLREAFSWNKGFREYFAVKATPNPFLVNILKEYDCGVDCSSLTELMFAKALDFDGQHIMFSSNATPAEEFEYAHKINATINLDDFTHIQFLDDICGIPETISCRFNPGGYFQIANSIMDNPGDAKYGFTKEQLIEGFKILKQKGARHFGIHAFLASNTVTNEYYPTLAKILFELAVEVSAVFINGLAAQSLKLKAGFFIDMLGAEVVFKDLQFHTAQIEIFKRMPEHLVYGKAPRTLKSILAPADHYGKLRTARKAVYADSPPDSAPQVNTTLRMSVKSRK